MVSRRKLLSGAIASTGAILSGCISRSLSSDHDDEVNRHRIDMFNGSQEPHVYDVTVANAAGESIFEHTYNLDGRKAVENKAFKGNPETFTVAIDDDEPIEFPWNPDIKQCSKGTTTSLTIYYQLESDPEITPIYECNTVTD